MAATDSKMQVLTTFEPFQHLPYELRQEVWRLALPSFASTVKILIDADDERRTAAKRDIPPLLHCCHESRAMALEYYKLGFELKSHWFGRNSRSICDDEVAMERLNSQLYWDSQKDLVCLEELGKFVDISYAPGSRCYDYNHYIGTIDPNCGTSR